MDKVTERRIQAVIAMGDRNQAKGILDEAIRQRTELNVRVEKVQTNYDEALRREHESLYLYGMELKNQGFDDESVEQAIKLLRGNGKWLLSDNETIWARLRREGRYV